MLGIPTQKPEVERAIRDFRHWFSKGIDLSIYSRNYYQEVANIIRSYKKDWGFRKKLGNWIRIIVKQFTKMIFLFVKP